MALFDRAHAKSEAIEVDTLRGPQRERLEERDDLCEEITPLPHYVPLQMLAMVVVASVDQHLTDPEEALELPETVDASLALHHGELVRDLEAGSIAGSSAP